MKLTGLAVLLALVAGGPSRADEQTLPPMPRPLEEMATTKTPVAPGQASMEAWGREHPDCLEWTDSCQVCVAGDKPGCSTVATACVRAAAPTCTRAKPAAPPNPAPLPPPRPTTDAPARTAPGPAKP